MAPCRSKVIDKYDLLEPREKESACVCVCVCVACHKYVCTYRRCVYFFFFFFKKVSSTYESDDGHPKLDSESKTYKASTA